MSSHDERGKEPIILTSPRRMAQGLAIIVITLGVGAAIIVPFFDEMFKNPPPVSLIRTERPPPPPPQAGTTTIAMLQGASTQGNPDYDPDDAKVPLGNKIVWVNEDTIPHTATSGIDNDDPDKGKIFDTGIVTGSEKSKEIDTSGMKVGDSFVYFCTVHPYMTGKLTITAAESGSTGGAAGPTLAILQGASTQGSPDYDPDTLEVKKGDVIKVVNEDAIPHTVTSGTGLADTNSGKLFNTNILLEGKTFDLDTAGLDPGEYDYYCTVHEYMKGKLKVT